MSVITENIIKGLASVISIISFCFVVIGVVWLFRISGYNNKTYHDEIKWMIVAYVLAPILAGIFTSIMLKNNSTQYN